MLSGGVKVEFNSSRAEDPHNLFLVRADGTGAIYDFDEQGPGAVTSKTVSLSSGRWRLFCSLPGHEALGMKTTLTVSAGSGSAGVPRARLYGRVRSGGRRRASRG